MQTKKVTQISIYFRFPEKPINSIENLVAVSAATYKHQWGKKSSNRPRVISLFPGHIDPLKRQDRLYGNLQVTWIFHFYCKNDLSPLLKIYWKDFNPRLAVIHLPKAVWYVRDRESELLRKILMNSRNFCSHRLYVMAGIFTDEVEKYDTGKSQNGESELEKSKNGGFLTFDFQKFISIY